MLNGLNMHMTCRFCIGVMDCLFQLAMCAWCCRASVLVLKGENGAVHFGPDSSITLSRTGNGNLTLQGNLLFADPETASGSSLTEMLFAINVLSSSMEQLLANVSSLQADVTSLQDYVDDYAEEIMALNAGVFSLAAEFDVLTDLQLYLSTRRASLDEVAASSEVVVEYIHTLTTLPVNQAYIGGVFSPSNNRIYVVPYHQANEAGKNWQYIY
jgi:hypothetical protein